MNTNSAAGCAELSIDTEVGEFVAHYSDRGLVALDFPGTTRLAGERAAPVNAQIRHWHATTTCALQAALIGSAPDRLPPLDWSAATDFQRSVWDALKAIACGHTRSYAEIARAIGQPEAVRAVGGACGANPIPVLVPCHRVLAAGRKIGGFSAGLDWKRKLLEREGIKVSSAAEQLSLLAKE